MTERAECDRLVIGSGDGDGLRLGEAVGGLVDDTLAAPGAYCPVSLVPYRDGTVGRFPHIIERNKPGIIGVLADGRRFRNEGNGLSRLCHGDAARRAGGAGGDVLAGLHSGVSAPRVLHAQGRVIPGLYAAGTDMASVMGGHYPAGGINLGRLCS